jgi:hypothetical protein
MSNRKSTTRYINEQFNKSSSHRTVPDLRTSTLRQVSHQGQSTQNIPASSTKQFWEHKDRLLPLAPIPLEQPKFDEDSAEADEGGNDAGQHANSETQVRYYGNVILHFTKDQLRHA